MVMHVRRNLLLKLDMSINNILLQKTQATCITLVPHQLHTICDFSDFQLKTCVEFALRIDWQVEIDET
jgi:hypothetical protein